ncbi:MULTISPECIES: S24 family peptidase [unclassified Pseudoalteromonas]|uniref:S24 family peptidase n=1 Tax=unclassified Pseudoalteromonas TaxID=194690 RepID=UPI0022B1D7B6|nr:MULTISPECIES: S24 family peptidase [unclassified Pseudoalteromonas]
MPFKLIRITGHSMSPRIPDKSYVLLHTWLNIFKPEHGNALLIKHPKYGDIIKSLDHIDNQGFFWFKGESEQSVSMIEIGPISKCQILAKVCFTLSANR